MCISITKCLKACLGYILNGSGSLCLQYVASSSVLGTVLLKLLQQLFQKLPISAAVPSFRPYLMCPWRAATFISWWIHQLLENTFVSGASRASHRNLLLCIHLTLLSTAIYYTHFYCSDVPSDLVVSTFHHGYLISGFLLWSSSFISAKLDIPPWCMTGRSSSPSLHLLFHVDSVKKYIFFLLIQVYLLMYYSFKIPLNKC